jgi:hypothetical protein
MTANWGENGCNCNICEYCSQAVFNVNESGRPTGGKDAKQPDQRQESIADGAVIVPPPVNPACKTKDTEGDGHEQIGIVVPKPAGGGKTHGRQHGHQEKDILSPRHILDLMR